MQVLLWRNDALNKNAFKKSGVNAKARAFLAQRKSVVLSASFIRIKHTDPLKLTGINDDEQGKLSIGVIY